MNRRGFLQSILAAGVAPAFVGSNILMPVRTPMLVTRIVRVHEYFDPPSWWFNPCTEFFERLAVGSQPKSLTEIAFEDAVERVSRKLAEAIDADLVATLYGKARPL